MISNKNLGITNQLRLLPSEEVPWGVETGAIPGIRDSSPIQSYLKKVKPIFLIKNKLIHEEAKTNSHWEPGTA